MDPSSGYEAVSQEFLARRGSGSSRSIAIGVKEVRNWARTLPQGSSVIDLGCGPGYPITAVLVEEGLEVFGVDAAPSFVAATQRNLPGIPIMCEPVQQSTFFSRTFDAVLAWGLMFLLHAEDQHQLIRRLAEILVPGRPATLHLTGQSRRLERSNDRAAVNLSGSGEVQKAARSGWFGGLRGVRRRRRKPLLRRVQTAKAGL